MNPEEYREFQDKYQGVALSAIREPIKGQLARFLDSCTYRMEGWRAVVCRHGRLQMARPKIFAGDTCSKAE